MIVDEGKYYLYRHIRLDTNEIFYIGVGKKKMTRSYKYRYWRMYERGNRNDSWKKVVQETDYVAEVVFETNDSDFLYSKEIELIKLYGRADLGLGKLTNLTDGGEWMTNISQASREKMRQSHIKSGLYKRLGQMAKERLTKNPIKSWLGKKGKNHLSSRAVYCYNKDGSFFFRFESVTDAALFFNKDVSCISGAIKNDKSTANKKFYFKHQGERIEPFLTSWESSKKPVYRVDISSGQTTIYSSRIEAAHDSRLCCHSITRYIKFGKEINGYLFYNNTPPNNALYYTAYNSEPTINNAIWITPTIMKFLKNEPLLSYFSGTG